MLRLYRKQKKGLIGVDISSTSVKILELSKKSDRYHVESYGLVPLPEGTVVEKNIVNPEAVAEAIQSALDKGNPSSDQAAFAVPTSSVITKIIEMDSDMTDDEREVQIRLDAEQYIPFPLDEVSLDFEVLSERAARVDKVNVLLVATRTENVDARTEALMYAGLTPKVADVENYTIERAVTVFANTLPMGANIVAMLDIGHSMTTLSVMDNGKIIYTREHMFGGRQLTLDIQNHYGLSVAEAGRAKKERSLPDNYTPDVLLPFMESVAQQAERSLQLFFSATQYVDIDHILLAGGTANLEGLSKYLQQQLNYRVTVANPFVQMSYSPQVNISKIEQDAPSLMVACGLALRSFD